MKMKDVAALLGVSRQTVSAVLNGKEWVSEETRRRVLETIDEHGYTPNPHAVSLAGKSAPLIGVVLRDISNMFYTQLAMGIESVTRSEGYDILYYNTFENHDYEVEAVHSLLSYRVSGVIISPIILGMDLSHLWKLWRSGTPFVSIDKIPSLINHSISFENERAAYDATRYLIGRGHRRLAFLGGPESSISAQARLMGHKSCLLDHGIAINGKWIAGAGTDEAQRNAAAHKVLDDPARRPTAVLCFNDLVAINVYKAAHALHLHIPNDLSVMGFDDIEMASLLGPPLTTMRLDSYRAGAEAARIVMESINRNYAPASEIKQIEYAPELIERESVKQIAQPGICG
ncbi:MAG: LacI family DNA-binding transcriptional regulator [Candidatus Sumerlaeota bacterium]|nr:LacI family DNA-binding transcriptional regulator [Candidatus Sumerlaeota bacterium]